MTRPRTVEGRASHAFIVGAPRCGTTALAHYLAEHPKVCFSSIKEPHFFSRHDLRSLPLDALRRLVASEYLNRYFTHCAGSRQLLAEASVTYLYLPEQMQPIVRLWPNARFIIALRDPMTMVPSLHQRLLCQGDETVSDLERAWQLEGDRTSGRSIPRSCVDPRWLCYGEAAQLGKWASRFVSAVGRERCAFVLFDDLKRDPAGEYRRILAFLGLPNDHRTHFPTVRASRGYRYRWLQQLLNRPPVLTRPLLGGRAFGEHLKPVGHKSPSRQPRWIGAVKAARKRLLKWNRRPAKEASLSPRLKAEIREQLSADVDDLARLIGRDLGHWLGRKRPARAASPALEPSLVKRAGLQQRRG